MGLVARGTQPVPDRAVLIACLFYLCSFFFMTTVTEAHLLRSFLQKLFEVRCVRGMTAGTLPFGHRLVDYPGMFDLRHLIRILLRVLVATVTQGELGLSQKDFGHL